MKKTTLIYLLVIALFILLSLTIFITYKSKAELSSLGQPTPRSFTASETKGGSKLYRNELSGRITAVSNDGVTIFTNDKTFHFKINKDTDIVKELSDPKGPTEAVGDLQDLKEGITIKVLFVSNNEESIRNPTNEVATKILYK